MTSAPSCWCAGNAKRAGHATRLRALQRRQQAILERLDMLEGTSVAEADVNGADRWRPMSLRFKVSSHGSHVICASTVIYVCKSRM